MMNYACSGRPQVQQQQQQQQQRQQQQQQQQQYQLPLLWEFVRIELVTELVIVAWPCTGWPVGRCGMQVGFGFFIAGVTGQTKRGVVRSFQQKLLILSGFAPGVGKLLSQLILGQSGMQFPNLYLCNKVLVNQKKSSLLHIIV